MRFVTGGFESIGREITLRSLEGEVVQVERRRRELELQLQTGLKHVESCESAGSEMIWRGEQQAGRAVGGTGIEF